MKRNTNVYLCTNLELELKVDFFCCCYFHSIRKHVQILVSGNCTFTIDAVHRG